MKEKVYFYLVNGYILMQSNIFDKEYIKATYNNKNLLNHKIYSIDRISAEDYFYLLSKSNYNKFKFNYLD